MDSHSHDRKMFYGATPEGFKKALQLRGNETAAEKFLWERLSKNQLHGFRFKRQHPIGNYITDFYCHKAKLVIEIDGDSHNAAEQKLYDKLRTEELEAFGLNVIRFTNEEVFHNIDQVIKKIVSHLPLPNINPSTL